MISLPPLVDRSARVLLVDGSVVPRDALWSALREDGHDPLIVQEGHALVDAVVEARADLVLVEARTPLSSVLESIGDLRMLDEARLVPVVLFSRDELDQEEVVRGLLAGADDFCVGRGRERELLARVRVQLRNRRDRELLRHAERERQQLVDAAWTDPLTGLGNRRAADSYLERSIAGASSVLLMVADIDHFKRVNDTWGHAAGDDVLRAVGSALRRMARDGDQVARYGGEEFIVVIRDAPPERHEAIATRFLECIRRLRLPEDRGPGRITASFGAATWIAGETVVAAAELFREADEALYRAKHEGRDRVVWTLVQGGTR